MQGSALGPILMIGQFEYYQIIGIGRRGGGYYTST